MKGKLTSLLKLSSSWSTIIVLQYGKIQTVSRSFGVSDSLSICHWVEFINRISPIGSIMLNWFTFELLAFFFSVTNSLQKVT